MVMIMIFLLCDLILIIDLLSHSHPSPLILFSLLSELWWIFKRQVLLSVCGNIKGGFLLHMNCTKGEKRGGGWGQWTNIVDF